MSSEEMPPPTTSTSRPQSSKTHLKSHKTSNLMLSSSNLRDTLSSFGDDLVRIKDSNFLYFEGNESNTDQQISAHSNQNQTQIQFERVPSEEVGVRSSRWRKAIVAGLFSSSPSSASKHKIGDVTPVSPENNGNGEGFEMERGSPPFWGVGQKAREKISMLSLQLVLHELACFASCALLGCLAVQLITGNSWNQRGSQPEWIFNRCYESFVIFLMGVTAIGFLLRIDTSDPGSLLTSPLHFIPIALIVVPVYLVKAWELQREECLQYLKMGDKLKNRVHLTQNCDPYLPSNGSTSRGQGWDVTLLVMNIVPIIACFFVSVYLFSFRNTFYLIDKFNNGKKSQNRNTKH